MSTIFKIIILVVLCLLAIAVYIFNKKWRNSKVLSIVTAGVSVVLLLTVIVVTLLPVKDDTVTDDKNPFLLESVEGVMTPDTGGETPKSKTIESEGVANESIPTPEISSEEVVEETIPESEVESEENSQSESNEREKPVGSV